MDERIIAKIKKCLRLAKSSNQHEAARAMAQAQKLMAMHGITDAEVALSEVGSHNATVGRVKKPAAHLLHLASLVASVFGCDDPIIQSTWRGQWRSEIRFIGIGNAAELAAYAYDVLRRQLERDRRQYIASLPRHLSPDTKTRRGDLFALAWLMEVKEKVQALSVPEEHQELMRQYRAKEYEGKDLGKAKPREHNFKTSDGGAVLAGSKAGKNAQLHAGVTTPEAPAQIGRSG